MMKRTFALLAFAVTALCAAVADKVYVSDFSIKAGEAKLIAVNFDSERTDLKRLEGTITMPAGLTVMNQGTATSALWMTPDATRTNGAISQYNSGTCAMAVVGFGSTFNAGIGAIAYIKVTASTDLADVSTITLSGFKATTSANETVNLTSQNCTVTREAGSGGGDDPTPVSSDLAFSYSPATLTMTAGEVKQVEVQMANGMSATGLQADLVASTGLSIQSVTKSSRMSGWNYNAANGRIFALGAISGNEGTVFTVSLKADADFSGAAALKASGLAVTDAGATSYPAEDITLPVTVQGQAALTAPAAREGLVYNGAAQELVTAGTATGGELLYSLDGTAYSPAVPKGTDAGTYTVYYKVAANESHTGVAPATLDVSVAKARLTIAALAEATLTYSGAEQAVNVSGVKAGSLDVPASDYEVTGDRAAGRGDYTTTVTARAESVNFTGQATAQWSIVAAGAAAFTLTLDQAPLVYDGQEKTPAVTVQDGDAVLAEGTDYELAFESNVNAGTAKVTVTGKGNFTGTQAAAFGVARKTVGLTWSGTTFDCDGADHQPAVEVTGLEGGDACTVTVEGTGEAVGSYTATATALGNANYRLPDDASCRFVIVRDMSSLFSDGCEWATYVAREDLATPEGLEAYVVDKVTTATVEVKAAGYIPAGTGVLLRRSDGSLNAYKGTAFEGTPEEIASKLAGSATEATEPDAYRDFLLYRDEFVLAGTGSIPAGRAYLPAAGAPAGAASRSIVAGGAAGIAAVRGASSAGKTYDLGGRRVTAPRKKAVYIRDGRKAVAK